MTLAPPVPPHVMWHDVECGRYAADLPLWDELARDTIHGVLDVGAGTGRVALALARAGHAVTALDIDAALLEVLTERAQADGLEVPTLAADAESFALEQPVGLVIVPMQTLQLLGDRAAFFAAARRALRPGGRLAAAIAANLESFEGVEHFPPPDYGEVEGWAFISQPLAIRADADAFTIVRLREMVSPDGLRTTTPDTITLAAVTPAQLAEEAAGHELEAEELRHVPETDEHVGAEVVIFRG